MLYTLLKILLVVISFQLLFIAFILFQNKNGKRLSNSLLALAFLFLGLSIGTIGLSISGFFIDYPILVSIDDSFILAYGPLLYLFTKSVLVKDFKIYKKQLLHFVPFFVFSLLIIFSLSTSIDTLEDVNPVYIALTEIILLSHIAIYIVMSRLEIKQSVSQAQNKYSNIPFEHISWLKLILNSFLIILITSFIHASLPLLKFKAGMIITLTLLIIYIFYFVNKVIIKMLNNATNNSGIITEIEQRSKGKYEGSKLTEKQLEQYVLQLTKYIEKQKPYLESNITLNQLAEVLDISPKVISQVINSGFSYNFFDFINKYRIDYAVNLLNTRGDMLTIQEIMYDSGFSSKSSFNTAFKKFVGLTPTTYKKHIKKGTTS